jgi:hypothetical protein
MPAKRIDLTGRRFGHLTVISFAGRRPYKGGTTQLWNVICDCGKQYVASAGNLGGRPNQSCGCFARKKWSDQAKTHGMFGTPEYAIWNGIMTRCLNTKHKDYKRYGAKGITLCERWRDFENFYADMGDRPSSEHSIDRFPDNQGNYEPGNCRWATRRQQVVNRKCAATDNGEPLIEIAERLGMNYGTLLTRFRNGERGDALRRPVDHVCPRRGR